MTEIHIEAPQPPSRAWQPPPEGKIPKPAGWLHFAQGHLSVTQVLSNLETAVSLLQTIDGALGTFCGVLDETIGELHTAWQQEARNGPPSPHWDACLAARLRQMDEIVRDCRFHGRGLLDGQSSLVGLGLGVGFVRGGPRTRNSPAEGFPVDILSPPTRATMTGGVALHEDWLRSEKEIFLAEGEHYIRHAPCEDADIPDFLQKLQRKVCQAGLDLEVGLTRGQRLLVRHGQYGSQFKFKGLSRQTPLLSKRPGRMEWSQKGRDIQGKLNGEPAFGAGRMLVGLKENPNTSDLAVLWRGGMPGEQPRVFTVQNSISFQDFTEGDLPLKQLCLPTMQVNALGGWLETRSRYRSLAEARVDSWQALGDTLQILFAVSCEMDEWRMRVRDWLKKYQELAMEYLHKNMCAAPLVAESEVAPQAEQMLDVMRRLLT